MRLLIADVRLLIDGESYRSTGQTAIFPKRSAFIPVARQRLSHQQFPIMHFIFLILAVIFPACANADGTLYLEDIAPLLKQQPELWSAFQKGFDIEKVGMAPRINSKVNADLGGARIAPYTFSAKPKGTKDFVFTVEIRANTRYVDAKGKDVPIGDAVKIVETLESITIKP